MFSISTYNITPIHSLAQAVIAWDKTPVWRNQHASMKPLDTVRMPHKCLVKLSLDQGYDCSLYNTTMVRYCMDGSVELNCHDTTSSAQFVWRVAPNGCTPTSHKGRMYWRVRTDDGDRYYRCGVERLRLQPTAAGNWLLTNKADQPTEWVLDRKLAAQARKLVKPYSQWYAVSQRMGAGATQRLFHYGRDYRIPTIRQLLEDHDNPATFLAVAPEIGAPINARNSAYLHLGARTQQPAPFDRLPRT